MKKKTKLPYTKEQLLKIGLNVASIWGGECIDFEEDYDNSEVVFNCIECGEKFSTTLKFDELGRYY